MTERLKIQATQNPRGWGRSEWVLQATHGRCHPRDPAMGFWNGARLSRWHPMLIQQQLPWQTVLDLLFVRLGIQITQRPLFHCSRCPVKSWQATPIPRTAGHLGQYKLCIFHRYLYTSLQLLTMSVRTEGNLPNKDAEARSGIFVLSGVDDVVHLLFCYRRSRGGFLCWSIAPAAVAAGTEAAPSSVRSVCV